MSEFTSGSSGTFYYGHCPNCGQQLFGDSADHNPNDCPTLNRSNMRVVEAKSEQEGGKATPHDPNLAYCPCDSCVGEAKPEAPAPQPADEEISQAELYAPLVIGERESQPSRSVEEATPCCACGDLYCPVCYPILPQLRELWQKIVEVEGHECPSAEFTRCEDCEAYRTLSAEYNRLAIKFVDALIAKEQA